MKFKIMLVLSIMLAVSCSENLSTDEAVELASIYIDTAETE
jgi:hypothetical protein